jgi:hypothetical protein
MQIYTASFIRNILAVNRSKIKLILHRFDSIIQASGQKSDVAVFSSKRIGTM